MNISSVGNVFGLIKQLIDTKKSTEPLVQTVGTKPSFVPKGGTLLERATPESCGVPSEVLLGLVKKLREDKSLDTHNLMVLRHGKVIMEAAFDDSSLPVWKQTYSACKSITALAVGFALQEGLFGVETKLSEIFSEEMSPFSKKSHKEITVEHLLTMTAGVTFGEADSLVSDNWIRGFMTSSVNGTPGGTFFYNSMNTYMLSAIIYRTSGMGLCEYLAPRLFEPLGIENIYWEKSPDGIEKGGWGMYISPEDMAKIGLLVMNKGVWNGKRILSESYIEDMTTKKAETAESLGRFNYGYQTWCGRDTNTFLFSGMLDQNVLGFRDTDILILVNSGNSELFQQSGFFRAAFDLLAEDNIDKIKEEPIEENESAYHDLLEYLDLNRIKYGISELPLMCGVLDGRKYEEVDTDAPSTGLLPLALQIFYNDYTKGLKSISFEIKNGKFYVLYREKDALHRFPVGFDRPRICNMKFRDCVFRVAISGAFAENEDGVPVLKLRLAFTETPCVRYIKFFFEGRGALASHRETPGMAFAADGIYGFKRALGEIRILKGAVGKVDDDYLEYRIKKTFAPSIRMKLENDN